MIGKKLINDIKAVSPIIGTILMVAITVIMAAIIANWSSGVKAPQQPQTVGLDVSRLSQSNITITVTSIDPPSTVVSKVNVTFKNGSQATTTRTILGDGAPNWAGYSKNTPYPDVNTNYVFSNDSSAPLQVNVGDSATLWINGFNEFIVITVKYGDGTVKTIYSQKI